MDTVSIGRLMQLHPAIRKDAIDAYNEAVRATPVNVHPFITETLRTFEKQQEYYDQGRTKPGQIITWSKPGQSYHQYGLAIDFVNLIDGKEYWPKDPRADKNWMTVVNIFKAHGFVAGIDWPNKPDAPHFEKTFGHNWRELLALHDSGKVDENGYIIFPS